MQEYSGGTGVSNVITNLTRFSYLTRNATLDRPDMKENTLIYALTADTVLRDEATKKFSAVGFFEIVNIPKELPSTFYSFSVMAKIGNMKKGHVVINVDLVSPQGQSLRSTVEGNIDDGDLDVAAVFQTARFSVEGRHFIKVSVNGTPCKGDENQFYIDVKKLK